MKTKESSFKPLLRGLYFSVLCIIIIELFFQFIVFPMTRVKTITVQTTAPLQYDDFLKMAGITEEIRFFSVKENTIRENLLRFPWIQQAHITKHFPHDLTVVITERRPLFAYLIGEGNERSGFIFIDEEGVFFHPLGKIEYGPLPILSGFRMTDPQLGDQLPAEFTALLTEMLRIKNEKPQVFSSLSECRVVRGTGDDWEILLYPEAHSLPIRSTLFFRSEEYQKALVALDAVQEDFSLYTELDMRGIDIVLKGRVDDERG